MGGFKIWDPPPLITMAWVGGSTVQDPPPTFDVYLLGLWPGVFRWEMNTDVFLFWKCFRDGVPCPQTSSFGFVWPCNLASTAVGVEYSLFFSILSRETARNGQEEESPIGPRPGPQEASQRKAYAAAQQKPPSQSSSNSDGSKSRSRGPQGSSSSERSETSEP